MYVWNLNSDYVRTVINTVSKAKFAGNIKVRDIRDEGKRSLRTRVTLTVVSSRADGSRVSASSFNTERRVSAACWHAYRDVMRALFEAGATRIKSAHADYRGLEGFEDLYPATGYKNIGSAFRPIQFREACDCGLNRVSP